MKKIIKRYQHQGDTDDEIIWEGFKAAIIKMFQKKLDSLETGENKMICNK